MNTGKVQYDKFGNRQFVLKPYTPRTVCHGGALKCRLRTVYTHHCLCRKFTVKRMDKRSNYTLPLGQYGHCCKCDKAIRLGKLPK